MNIPFDLIEKYDRLGPRYTSYPTAPQFTDQFGPEDYLAEVDRSNAERSSGDVSLYLHLPFCRSLCYYCACHVIVTHRLEKIEQYLRYLKREIDLLSKWLMGDRRLVQLHWGGGTPTYLSPPQIEDLMAHIHGRFDTAPDAESSIEADPRELTEEHLEAARRSGFNRISFGVQDLDPTVQAAINRRQPFEQVEQATRSARRLGFESISYDLIYGLPHQTLEGFAKTLDQVIALQPDRISMFSYAHVPSKKKHQQLISTEWLPEPAMKLRIFAAAVEKLTGEGGYRYIGMDHFVRPEDSLSRAQDEGTIHRNFQGYTTHGGSEVYAAGISGISQLRASYAQNGPDLQSYYSAIDAGRPATRRGYRLNADDLLRRHVIMKLMCDLRLDVREVERRFEIDFWAYFEDSRDVLEDVAADGLIWIAPDAVEITESGRYFIRNIVMAFDAYLPRLSEPMYAPFSRTV